MIRGGRFARLAVLLMRQAFGHFPFEAAAQPDEALRVLRQQLLVDTRLVVEPLGIAGRHELDQVVVALECFSEQYQVVLRFTRVSTFGAAIAGGNIHLAPENGIEPSRARMVI